MINYKNVYSDIQELKKKIKDLSFEQASKVLAGYNMDHELFDCDYGDFSTTIYNENGKATMRDYSTFDIYDSDYVDNGEIEHLTEKEIKQKIGKCRTDIAPMKWMMGDKLICWVVYYATGKFHRIKAKSFKTEKGAYKFYNSLPVEY